MRRHVSAPAEPGDRGRDFGAAHRDEIARTLAFYARRFAQLAGEPVDLTALGRRALGDVAAWGPALAAEIEGLAAGARLPVEHVAALNARTEILAACRARAAECSVAVDTRPAGPPLAAQTWDWHEELRDGWLVWTIRHPGGRIVHTLTEFGIVGKLGVASSRLGVLLNILGHDADGRAGGVPIHVLARRILDEAHDVDDALALIDATPLAASSAMTLVSPERAVTAELYPRGRELVAPDATGVLVHTNHFVAPAASAGDREPDNGPGSYDRRAVLRARMGDEPRASAADMVAAMCVHEADGAPVCCHPAPGDPPGERYVTLATVVLDVAAPALHVHAGGPCEADAATWTAADALVA